MQYKNKACSEFSAALSNYAQAVASARAGDTDWTHVVEICSQLPLTQSFSSLFHQTLRDSSVIVRRIAAEFLVRQYSELGPHARAFAEQLTADRCSDIAERGRYVLKKLDTEG